MEEKNCCNNSGGGYRGSEGVGEGFGQSWGAHFELGLGRWSGDGNAVLAGGVGVRKEHDLCGARRSQVE